MSINPPRRVESVSKWDGGGGVYPIVSLAHFSFGKYHYGVDPILFLGYTNP